MIVMLHGVVSRFVSTREPPTGIERFVIDVRGVGYLINAPAQRMLPSSSEVFVVVRERRSESAVDMFAFYSTNEALMFDELTSVDKLGPTKALALLSSYTAERLASMIQKGDTAALCKVPGIGAKMADAIIARLSERMATEWGAA